MLGDFTRAWSGTTPASVNSSIANGDLSTKPGQLQFNDVDIIGGKFVVTLAVCSPTNAKLISWAMGYTMS